MPLLKGKENIGKNIATERRSGKSEAQSVAIAESVANNAAEPCLRESCPQCGESHPNCKCYQRNNAAEQAQLSPPDLTQYVKHEGVPIFREDAPIQFDEDDEPTDVASVEDLMDIVKRNNARETESGDLSPIFKGHNKDDTEEGHAPIIGYMNNYRLGKLNDLNVILSDWYVHPDHDKELAEYPRRSVEYFPADKLISGVACLARQPKLDLGLLTMSKRDNKIRFTWKENMEANPKLQTPEILPNDEKKIKEDERKENVDARYSMDKDLYARLLKRFMAEDEAKETDKKDEPEDKEKEDKLFQKLFSFAKFMAAECAMPAQPSGTDTFVPELEKKKEEFSREAHEALKLELEATKNLYRKEMRAKDLEALAKEGYSFARDDELTFVVELDDEKYAQHLARIKKNYARSVAGKGFIPLAQPTGKGRSKEQCMQAAEIALKEKISFATALAKV